MLTLDHFTTLIGGEIFATGVQPNSPDGIFMTRDGGNLRWVAVKGYGNDWTIYCHWEHSSVDYIKTSGDKLQNKEHINLCVPCEESVMNLYRF